MQRRCLEGGRQPSGGRVDFQGGAHYSEGSQAGFVREEEIQWGETGLYGQDVGGSA